MKKKLLVLLFSLASLALVSCGGGNDVASSGASAVSAAAPVTTTTASPTPTTTPTEAKLNGQVDERTGVAPVVAQMTIWSPYANGGCGNSSTYGGWGPALLGYQQNYCTAQASISPGTQDCNNLGGISSGGPYNFSCGICC